ncbi:MAG: response regulator [Pirellulales bacterium]|nr:response regulator [Pirellulales bacterium]
MLVLSRACDTVVHIGPEIRVKILGIRKQRVKLGVDAPKEVRVWRDEASTPLLLDEHLADDLSGPGHIQTVVDSFLVVEDDPDHAELISRVLTRQSGQSCRVVDSATAALTALGVSVKNGAAIEQGTASKRPFLVLLDLHLPDLPGLEVLRRIRAIRQLQAMPVIVLSAERQESVKTRCLEAGANAFVPKSTDFAAFRQSLCQLASFWTAHCWLPKSPAEETVHETAVDTH